MFANKLRGAERRLGQSNKARTLRVEQLESRAMLSVTLASPTFKDIAFTISGGFAGTAHVQGFSVALHGNTNTTGDITYTSATAGTGTISVTGNITSPSTSPIQSFAMNGPVTDTNGTLAGSMTLTDPTGNPGPYTSTGSFSAKTFVATTKIASMTADGFPLTNVKWSGKIVQTDTTPFGVTIGDAAYSAGTLTVPVTVPGQAHTAASESAAAATITLAWANANGKVVGKAFSKSDTIDIAWNEASGTYTIAGLAPPTAATQIILKTHFDGKVQGTLDVPLSPPAGSGSASAGAGRSGGVVAEEGRRSRQSGRRPGPCDLRVSPAETSWHAAHLARVPLALPVRFRPKSQGNGASGTQPEDIGKHGQSQWHPACHP